MLSVILQVIKGFGLDRKVSTVAGSSQGGVAVKSDGDGACVDLVDTAEELKGGKNSKYASKLTAKRGLI